ncbi:IclR family transcriptional regulator [Sporosarcina sp. GW1-11]|uniref:IclR family transcriptional regulator n=1 Tax=Sporosarcina sp. GW1-11 TaxID=2899126 RepID=UPI00294D831C|nr:IclR family transcriptional regulator [Sporosarcina sp. GW1-11]MDV6378419.1 IclR family transcriptional regulator [Sporosarcina sp. GW1-11]
MTNRSLVPALDSSIGILELLAKEKFKSANLTEISTELSINKSTCLRILRALELKGYVTLDEGLKVYSLGVSLIALGKHAMEVNDYIEVASTYLKELVKTGLTFVLVKRVRGTNLMYMAKEEPPLKVRVTVSTGEAFPIPAGAIGKCFHAFLPDKEADSIIENLIVSNQLTKYTGTSNTSLKRLKEQILKIREEGIAECHDEYSLDISAYAVPIFDNSGNIILALGSYMPKSLLGQIEVEKLKSIMKSTAKEMTEAISTLV